MVPEAKDFNWTESTPMEDIKIVEENDSAKKGLDYEDMS
jgi:hypothetical protein